MRTRTIEEILRYLSRRDECGCGFLVDIGEVDHEQFCEEWAILYSAQRRLREIENRVSP